MTTKRCLTSALLSLSVMSVACGDGEKPGGNGQVSVERLDACLRGSGATIKEVAPPRHFGAEDKRLLATLPTGSAATFLVHRSDAAAKERHATLTKGGASAAVRNRSILLVYSGSVDNAPTLERCLREAGEGNQPPRGDLARQLNRIDARRKAHTRQYRNRQYSSPRAIATALERLRGYRRYRLYYLGPRYERLPLVAVLSRLQPPAYKSSYSSREGLPRPSSPAFDFIYGKCKPQPGSEGRCGAPLDIQIQEICARNPHSYDISPRSLTARVRGVPVFFNQGAGAFEIYTGATTIVIYASSAAEAARVARSLRSLDGQIGPGDTLPQPVRGALEGRLRCRPPPPAD